MGTMAPVKEIPCYLCGEEVMIGDDYNVHLTYAHGVEYDEDKILRNTKENKSEEGEHERKSFLQRFNEKISDMLDLAEGIVEPTVTINDENEEVLDDDQIWKMFENVKAKVMNMDISHSSTPTKSTEEEISRIETLIPPEKEKSFYLVNSKPGNVNANNLDKKDKKWYQGTFYECKLCNYIGYRSSVFRSHLQLSHKINVETKKELPGYSSNFDEQKFYACKICKKTIKHDYEPIFRHLKSVHSLTIQGYETMYHCQERNMFTSELQPIKSEVPRISQSKSGNHMPVKSYTVDTQPITPSKSVHEPSVLKKEVIPTPKASTFYYCPIPGCSYHTTKGGMKRGQAAIHLQRDHFITAKDMKPGDYKFDKISI